MTDYSDLIKRLRGKKLNCTCAAKSASECCCDTDWPESSCDEAADVIEQLLARITKLQTPPNPSVISELNDVGLRKYLSRLKYAALRQSRGEQR